VNAYKFWQFEFFQQWEQLKIYCGQRGIRFMGDVPIYVAHDSADIWAHPDLYYLDDQGRPTWSPACRPIISAPPDSSGESDLSLGLAGRQRIQVVDRALSVPRSRFSIWCDSIISVALNLTGRFPSAKRPLFTGAGSKGREKIFCRHCRTRFATTDRGGKPRRDYSAGEKLRQQFGLPGMSLFTICVRD